ncbi:hypothetical protein WJX75_001209 [Coccomyxa subellipsoidea]|uniref:Uncharacterized protein n=1 Tax=Coccomyxa subellipsoidea TaxID=248742 RepID=A0ABR2YLH7_9CHLO
MFANAQSIDKKEAPKFASNLEALADEDNTCRSALHLLSNFALESCRSSNLLGSGITRDSGARPELTAASVRSTDPVTGQPVSLDSSTPRAMPAAPQQAGPNAPTPGPESGTGASGQSGLLALNGTGAGGGVNAGGSSLTGQGASTGVGDGTTAGSGGVSDAAAFGNVGGLVFDGAGNIVGGQSTFGDVQTTYSGPQAQRSEV